MEKHYNLSDSEFQKVFAECKLDPSLFTHEAHLRLAWIYIKKYGIDQALWHIPVQLQRYVGFVGAKGKYNATVTTAAIKAVHHFMCKSKAADFKEFISEFPRLKFDFKSIMACHYGFDIYTSEKAKAQFLEPDLIPFD